MTDSEAWRDPAGSRKGCAAAFFDLDNTLIGGSSLFHLGWGGFKRGMFSPAEALRFSIANLRFLLTRTERSGAPEFWGNFVASFVKGAEVDAMVGVGTDIVCEAILPSLRGGILDLARGHLAAGDQVWIVTASPAELAEVLAVHLGFTGGLGTRAEIHDGRYTGRIPAGILHGPRKARAVFELARDRGIDLAASSAYTDSSNDIPLLTMVGFPHAVTPDRSLAMTAKRNGWPVHRGTGR